MSKTIYQILRLASYVIMLSVTFLIIYLASFEQLHKIIPNAVETYLTSGDNAAYDVSLFKIWHMVKIELIYYIGRLAIISYGIYLIILRLEYRGKDIKKILINIFYAILPVVGIIILNFTTKDEFPLRKQYLSLLFSLQLLFIFTEMSRSLASVIIDIFTLLEHTQGIEYHLHTKR